jgi:hypothetical protein
VAIVLDHALFLFPFFEKQRDQAKQALIVAYFPKQIMGNE